MMISKERDSQGRALPITLTSLTLTSHILLAGLGFTTTSPVSRIYTHTFTVYNILATAASFLGLYGAIRHKTTTLRIFTAFHSLTLLLLTIIFFSSASLSSILPLPTDCWNWDSPRTPQPSYQDKNHGFAWGAECTARYLWSLIIIKTLASVIGILILVAQWWAVRKCWTFAASLKQVQGKGDEEKGADVVTDEK